MGYGIKIRQKAIRLLNNSYTRTIRRTDQLFRCDKFFETDEPIVDVVDYICLVVQGRDQTVHIAEVLGQVV